MIPRIKAKIGDIFSVPIDGNRIGYGQVLLKPEEHVLFLCIFSFVGSPASKPDLFEITRSPILLAGNSYDAKIWHGHWPVIGNLPPKLNEIALPKFKYGMGDNAFVENLDRSQVRPATADEERELPFRSYIAPVGFELALKALMGIGKWLPEFDDIRYQQI